MTIVQNTCFGIYIYSNWHASFVVLSFLFPFSFFLMTYSRKPQAEHRYRQESANSKCLLHKKERGRGEREGQFAFFFVTNHHISLFKRLILVLTIERHTSTEKTTFSRWVSFFFFFFVSLSFSLCFSTEQKHRSIAIECLNKYFDGADVYSIKTF